MRSHVSLTSTTGWNSLEYVSVAEKELAPRKVVSIRRMFESSMEHLGHSTKHVPVTYLGDYSARGLGILLFGPI